VSIRPVRGTHGRRGAAVGALVLLLAACGRAEPEVAAPAPDPAPVDAPEPAPEPPEPEPEPEEAAVPRGAPARVVVPAIDVDVDLVELGLNPDGSMEVPDFGLGGWYAEGPPPGHPGPAVVAAHVDSKAGPDVFYRLHELEPGDEVVVTYDSGDEVRFVVRDREQTDKDELPADRIWPVTDDVLLTLITCGGEFDRSTGHYRDNIVVYTEPDGTEPVTLAAAEGGAHTGR
jgi:sortase (surface protein transpeptidase)